jgi:hypothetical protein
LNKFGQQTVALRFREYLAKAEKLGNSHPLFPAYPKSAQMMRTPFPNWTAARIHPSKHQALKPTNFKKENHKGKFGYSGKESFFGRVRAWLTAASRSSFYKRVSVLARSRHKSGEVDSESLTKKKEKNCKGETGQLSTGKGTFRQGTRCLR